MRKAVSVAFLLLFFTGIAYGESHYPSPGNIPSYISQKKNSMSNAMWINNLNVAYMKSLVQFFQRTGSTPSSIYSSAYNKIVQSDRGDLLLGLYFTTSNRNWVINKSASYASYSDYSSEVQNLVGIINKARLSLTSTSLNASAYTAKLWAGAMAGISEGWNPIPDAKLQHKTLDVESSLRYSFRMGQQSLRDATIREYLDEMVEQKKETSALMSFVVELCNPSSDIFFDGNGFDSMWSMWSSVSVSSAPPDMIKGYCSGILYYRPVTAALKEVARWIFETSQRETTVLCTQAAIQVWQSNQLTTLAEISLYQLNALYNLLQNFEK